MSALFDEVEKADTDARATDVDQLWIAESQRRYEAYFRGEIQSLPGDEVMAKIRSRLT